VVSLAAVVIILTILGLALLPAGIAAAIFNVRAFRRRPRLLSVPVAALSLGVGIAVAILSFSYAYALDPTHRVLGTPFPEVVLERHGESWEDFAGPLTFAGHAGQCSGGFARATASNRGLEREELARV